jgi:dethiobiotin synthetase
MRLILVTGTSTGVGKTIVTSALASTLMRQGTTVSVVKPVQTGTVTDEPTDAAVVHRLSGCPSVHTLVSLADPLAPDTAARIRGVAIPPVSELAERCVERVAGSAAGIVEGAGGVLVRLDTAGGTLLDLGRELLGHGLDVQIVIVTTLTLGTLNHTELTSRAIADSGLRTSGLVIGAEPARLGLAERCNLDDLPRVTGLPILGAIPEHAGAWEPAAFRNAAPRWLPSAADLLELSGPAHR